MGLGDVRGGYIRTSQRLYYFIFKGGGGLLRKLDGVYVSVLGNVVVKFLNCHAMVMVMLMKSSHVLIYTIGAEQTEIKS